MGVLEVLAQGLKCGGLTVVASARGFFEMSAEPEPHG
jgi:hypothetical protein